MIARRLTNAVAALVTVLGVSTAVFADAPTHREELIYSIVAFNGRDYSGTFVRQPSESVYLLSKADSFISARKTMVYFWPITGDYRLDTDTINRQFGGKLQIEGHGISRTLTMQKYTYFNVRGEYELNWRVAKGDAAESVFAAFQKSVKSYQKAAAEYNRAQFEYEQKLNELTQEIVTVRSQGGDPSSLLAEIRSLEIPARPQPLSSYSSPPVAPAEAFVVNLPAGVYHMKLINPDGTIMQGSEKRLVVFNSIGAKHVGYDVIPADKWTRPETSELPGAVLYVDGSSDLYLRPYFEQRYNDLYYAKLMNNDARGNGNMTTWVKLQQVPLAKILLSAGAQTRTVEQQGFAVQQLPGAALGYKIVQWTSAAHNKGDKPDIIAFHVPIRPSEREITVAALDEHGHPLAGAGRQIRIIGGPGPELILVLLSLLPLLVGAISVAARARRYSR